jgi:hypothetical protein
VASPHCNRWLVPPAALAIHLSIGMAYGFSVFWLPLSKALPGAEACSANMSWLDELTASCNWRIESLNITFILFTVVLGVAAAVWGNSVERVGPRKAAAVSALFWCSGLSLGALAIHIHQLWLLWLGTGVIGGIGLGLGCISPISILIRWFPERRGMATGMAVMGFGGGAMIGAPLAVLRAAHEHQRRHRVWSIAVNDESVSAPVLVNAAGAWADELAEACGADRLGLQPFRRTALVVEATEGVDVRRWPAVIDADEEFYFKPDAAQLLISPADEVPHLPGDAQPEEWDVAVGVERVEAALVKHESLPADVAAQRLKAADLSPERFTAR